MFDIHCPFCDTEFETETWVNSQCPYCNRRFYFEERCYDYENGNMDCYIEIDWELEE